MSQVKSYESVEEIMSFLDDIKETLDSSSYLILANSLMKIKPPKEIFYRVILHNTYCNERVILDNPYTRCCNEEVTLYLEAEELFPDLPPSVVDLEGDDLIDVYERESFIRVGKIPTWRGKSFYKVGDIITDSRSYWDDSVEDVVTDICIKSVVIEITKVD